jgi:hypothetical protein
MSNSQRFRIAPSLMLVVCGLGMVLALAPASVEAADSATEKPKAAPGAAEQTPEQAAGGIENLLRIRKACKADVKRMCAGVKPGGGRLLQCLHEHDADLSPVCREAVGPRPAKP